MEVVKWRWSNGSGEMEVAKWRVGEPHSKSPITDGFPPLFWVFAQWRGSNGGCEMDV